MATPFKIQKGVKQVLFYDFEVFAYDWLVVVMDMTAKKTHVIINSPEQLEALYKANMKEIWCGFNSRHYDKYILKAFLCELKNKKVNDYIIVKGNPGWKFSSLFRNFPLWNYDVMLGTDVGLKSFEGFMGNSYRPCFTLSDVLDLLPPTLTKRLDNWPLTIKRHGKEQWSAGYGPIVMMLEKELIDAAFGLVKWLHEEYDKPTAK